MYAYLKNSQRIRYFTSFKHFFANHINYKYQKALLLSEKKSYKHVHICAKMFFCSLYKICSYFKRAGACKGGDFQKLSSRFFKILPLQSVSLKHLKMPLVRMY